MDTTVQIASWRDLIDALETTYTTSYKDVCRLFRCSRQWVAQYIKPFVRHIYIGSGRHTDGTFGANWVKMAAMKLQRPEMTESVWFHTEDLLAYIDRAVVSCTKQTKRIPMTYLIPEDRVEEFAAERNRLRNQMNNAENPKEYVALMNQYYAVPDAFIKKDAATTRLLEGRAKSTARTKAPAVEVPLPDRYTESWEAPHDLKDYGDADEVIYRNLFEEGRIRIELQMYSVDGKAGTKIFYTPDPEPLQVPHEFEGYILVKEEAWQQYQEGRSE